MNINYLLISLTFLFFGCSERKATIREISKTFPTYGFSDPNPIAQPDRNYYPYFSYDGYSKEPEQKEWKVVELENAYVKVHILPEIGGKIWGAIEKSTGNEFLYYNSVVKFRNIAMRGPWTSGGLEMNFGIIGHSPHVSTPVDYYIRENNDGSVSCFIGGTELMTRARWETEINLQPDKAYFTTKTKYINPTPVLLPYYQWSNAAYQAEGGLSMIFPGNGMVGHGGEANTWPVSEDGINLMLYKNNLRSDKSYHIVGSTEGFYAAYWDDLNFGGGHYSPFGDKLGRKIFLWSQSPSGRIWEDLLTDNDGQYVEFQSGRLFNQAATGSTRTPYKHFGFLPYALDEFTEYWYPVMNTGGVVKANDLGALNVLKEGSELKILFSPLQQIKDEIYIYFEDVLRHTFNINLNPLEVWEQNIKIDSDDSPLKIVIGADRKFIYSEKNNITNRPVEAPAGFDWNSAYGLYTAGVNWIYQGHYDRAFQSFEACLNKEPYFVSALNHQAELYYRKTDYDNALDNLSKALSVNTYDPKANFVYGLVNRQKENLTDSQDGFSVASVSPEYRVPAYIELAKFFILKNQLNSALDYAGRVLENDTNNQEALVLMSVILRKTGKNAEAKKYIEKLEALSPLNHFSRAEKMFLNSSDKSKEVFTSMIRNELPYQTYLEIAFWYQYMGCTTEAVQILELSPENALVNLLLSYLYKNDNQDKSEKYFNLFLENTTDFVLPFRTEMVPVLDYAYHKSNSWKPKYYLGLLHRSLDNRETASKLFNEIDDSPETPYYYLTKAGLFSSDSNYNSENDLEKAYELGSGDWRTSLALIDFYLSKNRVSEALEMTKISLESFPENDVLQYTYAKTLLASGLYSESLNELENIVILPYEGARYGRTTYRQAAVMESLQFYGENRFEEALKSVKKARIWPENLGVGKPYDVDERIEDFLESEILLKLNETEKAKVLQQKIADYSKNRAVRFKSTDFVYLTVLKRMGNNVAIDEFLKQSSSNDPVFKWVSAMVRNNKAAAQQIEKEISTGSEGTPWDPRYSDSEFELIKAIANTININY